MKLPNLLSPLLLLRRGDVPGVLFVAIVLVAVLYLSARPRNDMARSSFWHDWDCQYVATGEDVCIKNTQRRQGD